MAYAGKAGRGNRSANGTTGGKFAGRDGRGTGRATTARGGRPETVATGGGVAAARPRVAAPPPADAEPLDWQRIAVFAGGVTLGLAFGAGAALLLAPRSGAATRRAIATRGRAMGGRAHDAWDDLRDDLLRASRRSRRRLRRRLREAWPIHGRASDEDC